MPRTSGSNRFGALRAVVLLATFGFVAPPAQADATESSLSCVYEDNIATSPSLTTEPRPYSFASVERGWIECTGTLNGQVLGGRGWFTQVGASGAGSLAYGTGGVDLVGSVPLLGGGEIDVTGHLFLTRIGLTGWGTGHLNGQFVWTKYVAVPCSPVCTGPPGTTATVRGTAGSLPGGQASVPSTPTGVSATVEGPQVHVAWEPVPDRGSFPVAGYRIYREHVPAGEVGADSSTFVDPSPGSGTHSYSVVAFNALGIESEQSERATVTIADAAPWEPEPSDPFNAPWHLRAETSGGAVSDVGLRWKAPRLKEVEGYEVYSSRDELGPIARVDGTRHVDPGVDFRCGRAYTYYVAAVAADGTRTWSDPVMVGPFTESGQGC